MGRPQDWCYSCYEIPPRGASSNNPAGHLLMAMRNKDERPTLSAAFMRLQAVAGFSYTSDQSLLSGVLSILPWQLIFVPCVNSAEVEWPNTNLVRQTIMQTLRPIEPGFQRPWASGMPGTIALAKVDCVLTVDRHSRVYRFDPIIKRWSATTDGVKPTVSGLLNGSSSDVPHTPHRLLILTTDLEVYSFRLCKPNMVASESGDYQLISSESQSKKLVKSFIRNLTTTVAHVRSSTGLELAVEYFNDADSHPPFTARTSQQHPDLAASPKSIDPFKPPVDTILDQRYRPINRNPVHPVHRLHHNWDHFKPDECVWVENTKFSFCRTYPLRVPSVPLKRVMYDLQLLGARTYFEGNRFPMLSYLYKKSAPQTEQNPPPNVWVLRSGHVESSVDVRTIINCDTPPHVPPIRLVHIQLDETSFKDLSGSLIDSSQTNFLNSRSRSTSDVLTQNNFSNNGFQSPSRWFVPTLKDSYLRFIPRSNEKQLRASVLPPDADVQDCQDCTSNMSWPTPSAKTVEQAWAKLGNLARLPQLHIPAGEKETPNSNLSKSQMSINTLDDLTGYSKRHPSTVKSPAGSTFMTPEVIRRNLVGHRPSAPSVRISSLSVTYVNDSDEKLPSLSVPSLKHGVPLQRKLSSVAAECSPHRSSWNDNFNATRWMALLAASLDQAVRLADCVRHLSSCCRTSNSGYYLLISGPGSGRTWQAIVTSLLQIILSPETRTLSGFEDLIEHEWVRAGYPFAPDPSDWHDSSVSNDYDSCASFALFLDCVHQLLYQFPVDFGFTEDYLVFLLDTALSRGGGLPPFAIEFSCSCDAARCISSKAKSPKQVAQQSDELCQRGVLRSFRDWTNVLTDRGLELLPNWRYWWYWHLNPTEIKDTDQALISTFSPPFRIMPELFPTVSPASYLRCWVHGWFRWNRSLRLASGGGYAFDAALSRSLLGPPEDEPLKELHRTKTSTSPYTGWMSDEAIETAESLFDEDFLDFLNSNSVAPLIRLVSDWELLPDLASQP